MPPNWPGPPAPPPPPPNAGPELFGRPNCEGEPKGPPGPGPGPLYGGPAELALGGGGKPAPLTFCGGPGPGVDEPEGAGDAVYCGVLEPGGGPWNPLGPPGPPPPPAGDPCPTEGKTGPPPPNEFGAPFGVKLPGPPADCGPGPTTSPGPPVGGPPPGPPAPFQPAGPPDASSFSALGRLRGAPGATPRRLNPAGGNGGARQRTGEKEQDVIHGIRTGLTTADCLHIIRWVNRKGWWLGELMMVGDWVDRWGAQEEGKETVRDCAPKRGVFTSLLSLGIES